jgi:hypothetical protein
LLPVRLPGAAVDGLRREAAPTAGTSLPWTERSCCVPARLRQRILHPAFSRDACCAAHEIG